MIKYPAIKKSDTKNDSFTYHSLTPSYLVLPEQYHSEK